MSKWVRQKGAYAQWSWGDYQVWVQSRPRDDVPWYAAQYRDEVPWLIDNASFLEARRACEQHALNQKFSTAVKIFEATTSEPIATISLPDLAAGPDGFVIVDEQAPFPAERYDGPPICDLATHCALLPDHEKIVAERDKLREFAERMIHLCEWGPSAHVESNEEDIADWAAKCGILVERVHQQPCEVEDCECDGSMTLLHFAWSKEAATLPAPQ